MSTPESCPTPHELSLLASGLQDAVGEGVLSHVEGCPECQARQAKLSRLPCRFAICLGGSVGALAYRDQPAISIQLHPEFEPAYAIDLIEHRRAGIYSDEQADRAIASFGGPDDRARVGGWINAFLQSAR